MAISFSGYKNTTLVGKNDLPISDFTIKVPQNNLTVHEYIQDQNQTKKPTSGFAKDTTTSRAISSIVRNTKSQSFSVNDKPIYNNKTVLSTEALLEGEII
jgi:hypothetical protein